MDAPNFNLDGKVALLTGAGRGIGLAMVKALAAHGCAVAIQDIDLAVAQAEVDAIKSAGGRACALGGDITDLALVARMVDGTVAALGGLHILINNAATQTHHHWSQETLQTLRQTFDADLFAPILLCQAAAPIFIKQRFGRIINIGSIQQRRGNPRMLPYSICKAALTTLTTALARDLAEHQVTVNLIAPGWFDTLRNRDDLKTEADVIETGKRLPMGRLGVPKDCAGLALLLCGEAGSYITGQSIFVDGGMSVW